MRQRRLCGTGSLVAVCLRKRQGFPAEDLDQRDLFAWEMICTSLTVLYARHRLSGRTRKPTRTDANLHLRARRRWELQAVLLPKLNHARNVLLVLRTQRTDFLKESFEARRCDDAHQATGRLAQVAVCVRYRARGENRRALLAMNVFSPTVHSYSPSRIWN